MISLGIIIADSNTKKIASLPLKLIFEKPYAVKLTKKILIIMLVKINVGQ